MATAAEKTVISELDKYMLKLYPTIINWSITFYKKG